jgi:5-methylcytosine-specific restriction endonuclease McrA
MLCKFTFLVTSMLLSQLTFSHSGGLNSEGCHNEIKTGGYHCHHSESKETIPTIRLNTFAYNRSDFGYVSYKPNKSLGFYTKKTCSIMNIDHLVSLKDAHESGAYRWSNSKKVRFANDRSNHVPSCRNVNISKGSAGPKEFLRRSGDGKGLDYQLVGFCEYVKKYHSVKLQYDLSFASNSKAVFTDCGIDIQ